MRPKQVVIGTRYFWERWAPRLGPTLSVLIVRLRMHCYFNQATQERRDWCFPTQQTLAEEIGVSRWTVMRELKKPEARQFVRVQYRSRYDKIRKITLRISSLYHVAMDDPLIDEDRGRAAILTAEHLLQQAEDRQDTHCGITEPGRHVQERPFTGNEAKRLITQVATGPSPSKLPPKEEPEPELCDADVVARELMQERVSPKAAERLAQTFPAELIREKMMLVRQMKDLRNTPGFLCKAIEDDYQAPLEATGTDGAAPLIRLQLRGIGTEESGVGCLKDEPSRPRARNEQAATAILTDRTDNLDVWQAAKQRLSGAMRPAAFAQWLQPSKMLHYGVGQICVVVPDACVQRYLEQRLKPEIESALRIACGGPTTLQVVVEGEQTNHA